MFAQTLAAQVPRHVYAVDASGIAAKAARIVRDNGFARNVTVIHGRMEDIELPVPQVRQLYSACVRRWPLSL
jgi:protein arginine N-methyltransferase 3